MSTKVHELLGEAVVSGTPATQIHELFAEAIVAPFTTATHVRELLAEAIATGPVGMRVAVLYAEAIVGRPLAAKPLPVLPPLEPMPLPTIDATGIELRWADQPDQEQSVTVGGFVLRVRLRWMARSSAWYVSVRDAGGRVLVGDRKVIAGWGPLLSQADRAGVPGGSWLVPEATDAGEDVRVRFFPSGARDAAVPEAVAPAAIVGQRLTFKAGEPVQDQVVEIDGAPLLVRAAYSVRAQAWHLSVWAEDGTPLVLGRKLVPGWGPTLSLAVPGLPIALAGALLEDETPVVAFYPVAA